MADPTPTPPGTPTQIYVRFRGVENGRINAEIGCDGEEDTTPGIRREGKPLLPSPFCGGEARMNTVKGLDPIYWADCPVCGATKRTAYTTARNAARAWNARRKAKS